MNENEYTKQLLAINDKYDKMKKEETFELQKRYVKSKFNILNIGEIAESKDSKILIERKIIAVDWHGFPTIEYRGVLLRKDGKPLKNGTIASIYQKDLKTQ